MHAHTPPFTKPTGAYDARKLREETIAIAQSQDRDNDCLVSILAAWRAVRKQQDDLYARLVKLAERKPLPDQYDLKQGEVKPDAYRDALDSISAATHESPPKWSPAWGLGTTGFPAPKRHPMQAEAIRDHDERLNGAEDRL